MRPRPSVLVGAVLGPLVGTGFALVAAVPAAWGATTPEGSGGSSAPSLSSLGAVLGAVAPPPTTLVPPAAPPVTPAIPGNVLSTPAASGGSGTVQAQAAGPSLTVTPDSGLNDGQSVTVSGSGYSASSEGGMAECNSAPGQPTISVLGNAVPVGCTNPLNSLQGTNSSGAFSASFTVHTGTVGPPSQGTDSSGGSASADAAKYPCPPTAAQLASGDSCGISYGDASGHQATANITFASQGSSSGSTATAAGTTAPGSTSSSASPGSAGASTSPSGSTSSGASGGSPGDGDSAASGTTDPTGASSGGALPFTGFGVGMWRLTLAGVVLAALGMLMMALGRRSRCKAARAAPASSG